MGAENREHRASGSIDRLIHEPNRFEIMAILFVVEKADFIYLMNQTGLTWGNLSSHLSKLENAGYIAVTKEFAGKKPRSIAEMTGIGRKVFIDYRDKMKEKLNSLPE